MEDLTTKEHVDRLPVFISGLGVSQLLGVPKISSGTGEAKASAVMTCLEECDLYEKVKACALTQLHLALAAKVVHASSWNKNYNTNCSILLVAIMS